MWTAPVSRGRDSAMIHTEGYRETCPATPDSRAAHDIRPAKELLETLMADAAVILKQLSASLQRANTFTSIT